MDAKNANQVGRYLYNHIDGAFKKVNSSNTCDVYITVLYQLPWRVRPIGEFDKIHEMTICISITHYAGKIRMNMIEVSPDEVTLGHVVFDETTQLDKLSETAFAKVKKFLAKYYSEYDFLY